MQIGWVKNDWELPGAAQPDCSIGGCGVDESCWVRWWVTPVRALDAVVVGAPGGDGLLDVGWGQVFGEGAADEAGEFGVGGEAEGDELLDGKGLSGSGGFGGGKECGDAEALLEADDAVLILEGVAAEHERKEDEGEGHDDVPEVELRDGGAVVEDEIDGENEVEEEDLDEDEVEGWVETGVVLEGLWGGHGRRIAEARDQW